MNYQYSFLITLLITTGLVVYIFIDKFALSKKSCQVQVIKPCPSPKPCPSITDTNIVLPKNEFSQLLQKLFILNNNRIPGIFDDIRNDIYSYNKYLSESPPQCDVVSNLFSKINTYKSFAQSDINTFHENLSSLSNQLSSFSNQLNSIPNITAPPSSCPKK